MKENNNKMIANNLHLKNPVHPGEIIKDELTFLGISQKSLADATGISYSIINEIIHCKRQVSVEYAMLFEATLNLEAEMLLNMQLRYNRDLALQDEKFVNRLSKVRNLAASVTL